MNKLSITDCPDCDSKNVEQILIEIYNYYVTPGNRRKKCKDWLIEIPITHIMFVCV